MNTSRDPLEATIAGGFTRRLILRQCFVCIVSYIAIILMSPWALMRQSAPFSILASSFMFVGAGGVLATGLLSWTYLRRQRKVIHAITMEPESIAPVDIGALANTPFALTMHYLLVGAAVCTSLALPPIRSENLDGGRAVALAVLSFTIIGAVSLVHYVVIRNATLALVELSPLEAITAWLEQQALRRAPRHRLTRKVLTSVVAPVALLGAGAVTVAHAHVRNFLEESRVATALILARTALEPTPIFQAEGGRDDVVAALAAHGFLVRLQWGKPLDASAVVGAEQLANGQIQVVAPLDDGRATMRFTASLSPEVTTSGVMIGLAALLLAGGLAFWLGRALANDLVLATDHIGTLGLEVPEAANETQRPSELAARARFREVVTLGENIQILAQRFQLFADTQERALLAKTQDRRMKQLLFASVSHDLKSPLNAILGFADLVGSQPLSSGQRESIDMVCSRGRELQALIETILDAARVDAGQLSLTPEPTTASQLLAQAAEKARHLQAGEKPHIAIKAQPHLPTLFVDPIHTSRALGVLISHALISCAKSPARQVRIAAHLAERRHATDADMLCITIEYSTRSARPSLLESELQGLGSPEAKRSMVLQLSLARSVIELHGGDIHAERADQRSSIVRVSLPVWRPHDIQHSIHRQPPGLRAT